MPSNNNVIQSYVNVASTEQSGQKQKEQNVQTQMIKDLYNTNIQKQNVKTIHISI